MKLTYTCLAFAVMSCAYQSASAAPVLQVYDFNQSVQQSVANANAWVEVSKSAFEHNIDTVKASLTNKTQLCAVLKADAYGHGIALLIPSIIHKEVNCIGVASNDEARIARAEGYKGRIVRVRQAGIDEIKVAMKYDIEEMVGNADVAREMSGLAGQEGRSFKIHVVTNAGAMSRNGLELASDKGKKDALDIIALPNLKTVAIMTHFAEENEDFIKAAHKKFVAESDWLIKNAKLDRKDVQLHCGASFAAAQVPEAHMDMVRVGASLFGDLPGYDQNLRRVMAFKSRVASVNTYPVGNTVGYDRTFTLKRDSRLANVAVGYSDGYRRLFTNKSHVIIDGQRVPTVGKVSMNTVMIDVTDFPEVKAGDEVVLFGTQQGAQVSQPELEELNGALLADLYTVWGNSNLRVLVD